MQREKDGEGKEIKGRKEKDGQRERRGGKEQVIKKWREREKETAGRKESRKGE